MYGYQPIVRLLAVRTHLEPIVLELVGRCLLILRQGIPSSFRCARLQTAFAAALKGRWGAGPR